MTTREQVRSAFNTQLEANILRMQMDMRAQQIEFELRARLNTDDLGTTHTHTCITREEWVASIAKSDQRWTAVQGCQTKADYMAEVVAHDRANDPPELYWRFRFPEEAAVFADPPVAQESWKTDQRGWDEWYNRLGESLRGC